MGMGLEEEAMVTRDWRYSRGMTEPVGLLGLLFVGKSVSMGDFKLPSYMCGGGRWMVDYLITISFVPPFPSASDFLINLLNSSKLGFSPVSTSIFHRSTSAPKLSATAYSA